MRTCSIEGCERKHSCHGWCNLHYQRWLIHGDPLAQVRVREDLGEVCAYEGCQRLRYQKSRWCSTHKMRVHRYGSPDVSQDRRGRTWAHQAGYRLRTQAQHALAVNGVVYEHRAVLYDKIGPGSHACHWCRGRVTWRPGARTANGALVVDHLDGDRTNNNPGNLVPSCHGCNATRGRWGPGPLEARAAAAIAGPA